MEFETEPYPFANRDLQDAILKATSGEADPQLQALYAYACELYDRMYEWDMLGQRGK